MKRFVCFISLLCLLLCSCTREQYELRTFSFAEHCVKYADQRISFLDTEEQKKRSIRSPEDAVAVAKEYCLINNVEISAEYDPHTEIYCVLFAPVFEMDGHTVVYTDSQTVHVYVNEEGIALMTIVVR